MSNKKVYLREAERSMGVRMFNVKSKCRLGKDIALLESNKDTVVNRITLNQRTTYKRFKQKLGRAKMTYAKIMGDKEMERKLRSDSGAMVFNTNYGIDPEDEEVLNKLRSSRPGTAASHSSYTDGRIRPKSSPVKSTNRVLSAVSIAKPSMSARPETVSGSAPTKVLKPRTLPQVNLHTTSAQYITTGASGPDCNAQGDSVCKPDFKTNMMLPEDDMDDNFSDVSSIRSVQTQKVTRFNTGVKTPQTGTNRKTSRSDAPNIFTEDTRPSLLDIQRERVKSANYENRVKTLCDRMKPFRVDESKAIPDYYLVVLNGRSEEVRRQSTYSREMPGTPPSEVLKSAGNPEVRSLTMKRLNFDFGTPDESLRPTIQTRQSLVAWN